MGNIGMSGPIKRDKKRLYISLRWVATLSAAGLVAITTTVISLTYEHSMRLALALDAQTQLVLESRNLAITSSTALLGEFPELTLVPLVKEIIDGRPEFVDAVITNHEEKIMGSTDTRKIGKAWQKPQGLQPLENPAQLQPGERLSQSPTIIMAECPIHWGNDSNLGTVAIVLDKSFIEAKIMATRKAQLTVAGGLLSGAVILTALLMSILFRPITHLRQGLNKIRKGDLDSPMRIKSFTELGMLGNTVNQMAEELKTSQNLSKAQEQELLDTQKEVITTLGQVVESRSSETANHTVRVGNMSYELAILAGLSEAEADLIRVASPMHDVGKIGIPDEVLNKPGKYTNAEYKIMQNHPDIGYNILKKSEREVLKAAAIIAHEHHERWDGNGYPQKIHGKEIHIYGRIVGIVDVFDALFSNRVYRNALPLEKVLEIIKEGRGTHFDPKLCTLFLNNIPKFLAVAEQYFDPPLEEKAPAVEQVPVHS